MLDLDIRSNDPETEARRMAALLDAVAAEAERIGRSHQDPKIRRALLQQVARSRADAQHLRQRMGTPWPPRGPEQGA